uniref:Putative glycosyltransferase n=1 Tax=viral metagenome TaxID=1070528 RepID=A0A6M3K1X6_9ZZZZ
MLIIIPAYNEEANIGRIVRQCRLHGRVVVIDDGSGDLTAAKAIDAGAHVISHGRNRGYGQALQTGYEYALKNGHNVLVQLDADGQHDPKYIPAFVREINKGADVVIGSRFLDAPGYRIPFFRRTGMKLFAFMATNVCKQRFTDTTSGYRAFNRRALEFCVGDKFPRDCPDANALVMMHRAGLRLREIPVKMRQSTKSTSMHSGTEPIFYVLKMLFSLGRG